MSNDAGRVRVAKRRELRPKPTHDVAFGDSKRTMSVAEFERYRRKQPYDITGVYVLHNEYRDKWYVGQSKTMLSRVHAHFSGHGCQAVYRDYRAGDMFFVQMITLQESGYESLDVLEHDLIHYYQADEYGYNVLRGNQVRSDGHDRYFRYDLLKRIVFPVKQKASLPYDAFDDAAARRPAKKVLVARAKLESDAAVPDAKYARRRERLGDLERETERRESRHLDVDPVYVSVTGSRYHRELGCRFVRGKRHFVSSDGELYRVDRSLVENLGYGPCRTCCRKEVSEHGAGDTADLR